MRILWYGLSEAFERLYYWSETEDPEEKKKRKKRALKTVVGAGIITVGVGAYPLLTNLYPLEGKGLAHEVARQAEQLAKLEGHVTNMRGVKVSPVHVEGKTHNYFVVALNDNLYRDLEASGLDILAIRGDPKIIGKGRTQLMFSDEGIEGTVDEKSRIHIAGGRSGKDTVVVYKPKDPNTELNARYKSVLEELKPILEGRLQVLLEDEIKYHRQK